MKFIANSLLAILLCVGPGLAANSLAQGDIFAYPAKGQSERQQQRDRYKCHNWAVATTAFDPGNGANSYQGPVRVPVENPHEGAEVRGLLAGAAIGGIIGAADHHAGRGAFIGAMLGSMVGHAQEHRGAHRARRDAYEEGQAILRERAQGHDAYIRALSACLEGRGYSVR